MSSFVQTAPLHLVSTCEYGLGRVAGAIEGSLLAASGGSRWGRQSPLPAHWQLHVPGVSSALCSHWLSSLGILEL